MAEPVRPDEIAALVAQFEASHCAELHLRFDGFELHLSQDGDAATAFRPEPQPGVLREVTPASPSPLSAPTASPPAGSTGADDLDGLEIVRAPYLGTFYRAPKPGEAAYVEIGASVEIESDICLVEVMKLFTAVRAGIAGTIAKVLATDGAMVETGQPLFAIAPRG